jgi:diguanylate cyclase (GGDEF)-like protein
MGSFKLKLALYFALLALLPTAIAFYGFESLAERGETRGVDERLQAGLRASLNAYAVRLDQARQTAAEIAANPQLQQALREGDRGAVTSFLSDRPNVTVSTKEFTVGRKPGVAAQRQVRVLAGDRALGRVVVAVPIENGLLRRIRSGLAAQDELVAVRGGRVVAGPHAGEPLAIRTRDPERIRVDDARYRALATSQLPDPRGIRLVALSPQDVLDAAARRSERRLFVGLFASLVLFGLVAYLLGRSVVRTLGRLAGAANAIADGDLAQRVDVRGRDEFAQLATSFNRMAGELERQVAELEGERNRVRDATARFGQALEATHDVGQLMHVIVETAVEATGAYGGVVLAGEEELARAGDPDTSLQKISLPLQAGTVDFGSLVLSAPRFDRDQVDTAASLAANAAIALENARLHSIVEHQALVDPLTELANRRALEETLHAEVARAARFGGDLCFVLTDLDSFKSVNDRWGHPVGDVVLREFARTLEETGREIDVAGRWGGEEFALILPGTDMTGGIALAERARAAVAARELYTPEGEPIHVTASFGLSSFSESGDLDALVAAADHALYRAKRAGKNRVVSAAEPVAG